MLNSDPPFHFSLLLAHPLRTVNFYVTLVFAFKLLKNMSDISYLQLFTPYIGEFSSLMPSLHTLAPIPSSLSTYDNVFWGYQFYNP